MQFFECTENDIAFPNSPGIYSVHCFLMVMEEMSTTTLQLHWKLATSTLAIGTWPPVFAQQITKARFLDVFGNILFFKETETVTLFGCRCCVMSTDLRQDKMHTSGSDTALQRAACIR